MTDKTPKNQAENPVNTSAALAKTTDTARDGEPKSRALPQADALKARFKAGSIPLQTDFADLIDLANIGRQAVGGAEGQTGPANGFTLSSEGRLELKSNAGITVDSGGVGVKVATTTPGISVDDSGVGLKLKNDTTLYNDSAPLELREGGKFLGVDMEDGIEFRSNGISVKAGDGVKIESDKVGVKNGNGIAVNSSDVNVKLAKGYYHNGGGGKGENGSTLGPAGGLNLDLNGLSVDAGSGIQINQQGVSIKLDANSGLSADDTNGLKIVPEKMFQKGMVMMFAGSTAEIPKGWTLCDGSNNTPNLIDRFILGSTPTNSKKFNSAQLTGSGNTKAYNKESTSEKVTGRITIADTKLTESHIPSHFHTGGAPYYTDAGAIYGTQGGDEYQLLNTKEKYFYGCGWKTAQFVLW